jgi:hypothetical protein
METKHSKCNNCGWTGSEDDLVICYEDGKYGDGYGCKGCPQCKTDAYLIDVEVVPEKHTPGPWENQAGLIITKATNRRGSVAVVPIGNDCVVPATRNVDEQSANARLIAAAPELLEALQNTMPVVMKYYKSLPDDGAEQDYLMTSVIQPMNAVIAKITQD